MANVLTTYKELKAKHPDAVLLFRCGDFYETYEQDAKVVSEVLGITLTFRDLGEHIDMAGFPHHALDAYLPKIIRAGHRVAICDMLEDPKLTKKLVKRGITELTTTATNNPTNNNSKSQENMKLTINNTKNESANVQNAQVMNPAIEDAEFEEVPQNTLSNQNTPTTPSNLPQVQFSTYKTKKGNVAPQIIGFGGEDDPRWKAHKDAGHKYVSASYRRDISGEKVYILLFGTKYMDVAKALAGAYNTPDVDAWHRAEDACMAIYEQAQRDGKARWEEKKQQWAAARSEKLKVKSEELAAAESAEKQVAAMLEKLMKGEDVPESILKHIDPEVLAKFTKAA